VRFINLQYGVTSQELDTLRAETGTTIHHWEDGDPLQDMDGFAAKVKSLDLVISIDNSTVHLAGALGVPVWTLLPYVPDWRWQMNGEQTLWYPSMRLFRQPRLGHWEPMFRLVAEQLAQVSRSPTTAVNR
jgi:ADP-heptose:LPS heptosyltransferase